MTCLQPWIINPVWQDYSSMWREAVSARESRSGVEQSHHLTAALYFAMSTLEAFLNSRYREHFATAKTEEELYDDLFKGAVLSKVKKWPKLITGTDLRLRGDTIGKIAKFNSVRSSLTHPKHEGQKMWHTLDNIEPEEVVEVVAEYIAQFHLALRRPYEYWLTGWNYLNPTLASHEIMQVNNQQFVFSMQMLGEEINAYDWNASTAWQARYFSDYSGYVELRKKLSKLTSCEPKHAQFPYQPKLCRRWWEDAHHRTCGFVSREAIDYAVNYRPGQGG